MKISCIIGNFLKFGYLRRNFLFMKQFFLVLSLLFIGSTNTYSQSILDLFPKYFASFGGIYEVEIQRINGKEDQILKYDQNNFHIYKDSIRNPDLIVNVKIQFSEDLDLQKAFDDLKLFSNLNYLQLSDLKFFGEAIQLDLPEDFSGIKNVQLLHLKGDPGWDFESLSKKIEGLPNLKHLAINGIAKDKFAQLDLGKLDRLKGLYLSGREGPTIPGNIQKLKNLEGIIISADLYPDFKEQFSRLNDLPSLKQVKMLYFNIEAGDEEVFQSFGKLERLELTNVRIKNLNKFMTALPAENNLKYLEIFGSKSEIFTHGTSRFRSLEHLKLERLGDSIHFPEDIFELKDLKTLMLSDNDNFTRLSSKIENLKELEKLTLYFNSLKHLPETIGNLENLEYLDLKHNNLEKLPASLGNLSSLQTLILDRNQLVKIPESIGEMNNLVELDLNANRLSGLPHSIVNLPNLQVLKLNENDIRLLPADFGTLTELRELYLDQNLLQELPSSFSGLESLELLYLRNNKLSYLPSFKNLYSLSEFFINNHPALSNISNYDAGRNRAVVDSSRVPRKNNTISRLPSGFADLERLRIIDISENPIETDKFWEEIKKLRSSNYSLKAENTGINLLPEQGWNNILAGSLYLRNNQIKSVPADLVNAPFLSILDISQNPFFLSGHFETKEKLAVVLYEAGHLPEKMLEKNSKSAKAYLDLSYQRNNSSSTLEYMDKAFKIDSSYTAKNIRRTQYAEALLEAGEYQHAIEQFTQEIKQDTASRVRILNFTVPLFENRAKAFLAIGDTVAAINDLRTVSERFNAGNWGEAGLLARKINKDSMAMDLFTSGVEEYEKQIEWNKENDRVNYGYQLSKLELLIIAEEYEKAKNYHKKLLQEGVTPLRNEVLLEYCDLILKAISEDLSKKEIQQFNQKLFDEDIKISGWSFELFKKWTAQANISPQKKQKISALTTELENRK
jgi:Leucine-rich repeat (LRR) protein